MDGASATRVTHELVGRHARLWGFAVIATMLITGNFAGVLDGQRLHSVPTGAVTDTHAEQGAPHDDRVSPGIQPAQVDPGIPRTAPSEDPRNAFARLTPYLEAFEPAGDGVAVFTPFVVRFSQPMARISVEQSFVISPRADGRLVWQDDFAFHFHPTRLAHGQVYEVRLGGRSTRGVPLPPGAARRFTTVLAPPIALPPGPGVVRVPIVMYHYIRVNPDLKDRLGFALSVTPADFAAQMDWLGHSGYHPITLEDLHAYLGGQRGLPSRPVILSFDDGYADFYSTALPILRAHDFTAVAYVVSGFMGRSGYMTAAQVVEANGAGVEIGAHSIDHVNLAAQSPAALRNQLTASRAALEQLLGHPVLSLCYPSGRFSPAVLTAAQAAGYRDATTTRPGSVRTLEGRYLWGRLRVNGGESLEQFASAVVSAS